MADADDDDSDDDNDAASPKAKSGTPFELRARDALQFLHPDLKAEHDVDLAVKYHPGRTRQFDVALRDDKHLQLAFEAKDYGSKVPIEKIEAFETKVNYLVEPPAQGAGLISSKGFQKGPYEFVTGAENASVRKLYQLRETAEGDWSGLFKQIVLNVQSNSMVPKNVRISLDKSAHSDFETRSYGADRNASTIYSQDGVVMGNLLDLLNEKLRELQKKGETGTHKLDFPDGAHLRLDGQLLRLNVVEFDAEHEKIDGSISIDYSKLVRDTLIDCISKQRWLIPDPGKALAASRDGYNVALTYADAASASGKELKIPSRKEGADDAQTRQAQFLNAIQLHCLLSCLRVMNKEEKPAPHPELEEKLEQAYDAFATGNLEEAKKLYWDTCRVATSLVALNNLAYIYDIEGDLNQALRLACRTIELFPFEVDGFINCASIHMARNELDLAREVIEAGKVYHAGHPEILRREADLLRQQGQHADAALLYAHVCALKPDDAQARLALAVCANARGLHAEAAWDAIAAWRLDPANLRAAYLALRMSNEADQFGQTIGMANEIFATAGFPNNAQGTNIRVEASIAAWEQRDVELAEQFIRGVPDDTPNETYWFMRGLVRYHRGLHAEAYADFKRYVETKPEVTIAWTNMYVTATAAKMYPEAHAAIRVPTLEAEADQEYWEERAKIATVTGDVEDAIRSIERATVMGADAAVLLLDCSDIALQHKNSQLFMQLRSAALQHPTSDPSAEVEQAILRIEQMLAGHVKADDIAAQLDRAERNGAAGASLIYARLLFALRADRRGEVDDLVTQAIESHLPALQILLLAVEANAVDRHDVVLRLLEHFPSVPTTELLAMRLPYPAALRASALSMHGKTDDAKVELAKLEHVATHPFHHIIRAEWAYLIGNLELATTELDAAERLNPAISAANFAFRLQLLIESGKYAEADVIIQKHIPNTSIAACAKWWSRNGDMDLNRVNQLIRDIPSLAQGIPSIGQPTDFVCLLLENGKLCRSILTTDSWEASFDFAMKLGRDCVPVLARTRQPIVTLRRIRRSA